MQPLLRVENLVKHYAASRSALSKDRFAALHGVSLSVPARTTLALVGESGSGKSTLALGIACLEHPTSESIWFESEKILRSPGQDATLSLLAATPRVPEMQSVLVNC